MSTSEKRADKQQVLFGGSCACGRMTYESTSFPTGCQKCHCITCQKLSGGPYQCFADVISKEVIFYDNKESLRYEGLPKDSIGGITFLRFSKVGERAFCIDCYSPLAMRYLHEYDLIYLTLGTVDEGTIGDGKVRDALKPVSNIFGSHAAWWNTIEGGLPVHDRFAGTFEEDMRAWGGKDG